MGRGRAGRPSSKIARAESDVPQPGGRAAVLDRQHLAPRKLVDEEVFPKPRGRGGLMAASDRDGNDEVVEDPEHYCARRRRSRSRPCRLRDGAGR
jgi:hypothetical protein